MLKGIIDIVDTSGDGKIQYEGGFGTTGRGRSREGPSPGAETTCA
jgi:hypothetical protein